MGASAKPVLAAARRSDRVELALPIQVIGDDSEGNTFVEDTHTLILSRHGAKILLNRSLVPEQELTISCATTGKEAVVRVVGQLGKDLGAMAYGIMFLDSEVNLWDIEFPPLAESENAAGRALLECMHCHSREVAYLDEIELEILAMTHRLSRSCKRCGGTSLWQAVEDSEAGGGAGSSAAGKGGGDGGSTIRPSLGQGQAQSLPLAHEGAPISSSGNSEANTSAPQSPNLRQKADPMRVLGLRVTACVRHLQMGDEVVVTEKLSKVGVTFKSVRHYGRTLPLQIAVPYVYGSVNIFAPVQIEAEEFLPEQRLTRYAVSYLPVHRGWPKP